MTLSWSGSSHHTFLYDFLAVRWYCLSQLETLSMVFCYTTTHDFTITKSPLEMDRALGEQMTCMFLYLVMNFSNNQDRYQLPFYTDIVYCMPSHPRPRSTPSLCLRLLFSACKLIE